MEDILHFATGADFRRWLEAHVASSAGVWLLFGKAGGPKTLKAGEALEEALCFGWIDGQMQRIDEGSYRKYFSPRRRNSPWSEKNRALAQRLEDQGRMTDWGREQMALAQQNGRWDAPGPAPVTEAEVARIASLLEGYEPAHTHFQAMSPSVKRTYTRGYLAAKTDAGREKRLAWMIDRLNQNLKPM